MGQWWYISIKGRFIGKVFCAYSALRTAIGPWHSLQGNSVNVFAPPNDAAREDLMK